MKTESSSQFPVSNSSFLRSRSGQLSVTLLFFAALAVTLISGFVFLAASFLQLSVRSFNRAQAFEVAEAGIEYYRWHLAHDADDYWDGQGASSTGPYVHPYFDKNGTRIGQFELAITPPPPGSTVVTIRSTGKVEADLTVTKVIQVKVAIPSFAKYAVAADAYMRFGEGTQLYGEVFSNQGVRVDGVAHNTIRSAVATYDDPDHGGQEEFGVHTHSVTTDPLPPDPVPTRADVFMAGRQFPVPALDFVSITQDLAALKSDSQSSGFYASSSGAQGFDLVFNGSNYAVYKVTALTPAPGGCTNTSNEEGWGTWSIASETLYASGTIPASGKFFFEDNVWVRGTLGGARVSVGAARFPDNASTRASITVNQDLRYSNFDGSDIISLIAQKDINVGLFSNDVLRIDGALIAQNGRIGRYYYSPPNDGNNSNRCGPTVTRQRITLYGMLVSSERYGFGFDDSTGYILREIIYDANLLYAQAPGFPLITNEYSQVSWDEVQ
jgi:hypothetical protein